MDMRDLMYFQAVAQSEHMGKAAERLFITQPALTKAVHRLEEEIGAPLFKRAGRRIALTDLGRLLEERTRHVKQVMDDTMREVKNFAGGLIGHIRMGCAPTMTKYLLPIIIPQLIAKAPGVTVEIRSSVSDELWEQLREGALDLTFTTYTAAPREGFNIIPLIEDEVVVVAGRDHPIFSGPYTVKDLDRYNWVLPKTSREMRPWLDARLQSFGCAPPRAQVQVSAILYMPRLIASTNLLSFISRRNIDDNTEDGQLVRALDLPEMSLHRVFGVSYRESRYLSPAVLLLIDLLRAAGTVNDEMLKVFEE